MRTWWMAAMLATAALATARAEPLKINGSTTVNPVAVDAAEVLRAERKLQIQVDTQGGSSGGISGLGDGLIDIGMSSKPLTDADRARYPRVQFRAIHIGEDAVALIVSRDVWDAGVRALTREQAKEIYEGRITNWKQVGGADQRIVFFNKEPGRGTWEVFAHWLYGDPKKAPPVSLPEVGANEETRTKVGGTRGAISQLSSSWADHQKVFALAIQGADGATVEPTPPNIANHKYPMSRPLFLLTNGEPQGDVKTFIDFVLGDAGQRLVRKHGYLSLDQLRTK